MANKTLEFFKKRQANEPNIQNNLNANAQAQAMMNMNMQAQMGRGIGQTQPGFQQMQQQMQASQFPQQQQQPPQGQQQMGMGMGMGMGNQAGRGMTPNQQGMGIAGGQNRQGQPLSGDISRLGQADRAKVMDLAAKMMGQATEQQKTATRLNLQQRLTPQQLADLQSQGRDPLIWFFQTQAFHMLKNNMTRLQHQQQAGAQGQNGGQNPAAAMMQPQQSQQTFQPRQNVPNAGGQQNDFSHFNPSMDSIKDQQMTGLMAQQAGQMVVPASGGGQQSTPQQMNQAIPGGHGQNQTPRQGQQQSQAGVNMQQLKMNQAAAQQSQNQMQLKMQQQQSQQTGMPGGMPPSQSPAMNTLNAPVSRPQGNKNPMAGQGMGQTPTPFGDQRFNQGTQRPNSQAFNNMLANMSQEQRQAINGLPPDKLNDVIRRWQTQRQDQINMSNGQLGRQQNNGFAGQMGINMGPGQAVQNMQQPNAAMGANQQQQQQMAMPRMPIQNNQAQAMMDTMDLPPQVQSIVGQLPVDVKKWRDLKIWLSQNSALAPTTRSHLGSLQQRQFQVLVQRRASMQQQAGQNPGANASAMQNSVAGMANQQQQQQQQQPPPPQPQQQMGMQRPPGNIPPQVLQVTPQELSQVRNQRPNLAHISDEQLRVMVVNMKRQTWQQQQQSPQQLRAQQNANMAHGLGPQPGAQAMQTPQGSQQTTRQTQQQGGQGNVPQTASMQSVAQKQQPQLNEQGRGQNKSQTGAKSLKRPSTDTTADTTGSTNTAANGAVKSGAQQGAQGPKGVPTLTPQQLASLSPEQRAKYEQFVKMQMASQAGQGAAANQQPNAEILNRLRAISQEEIKQFNQETMSDISMSSQEHNETGAKLQRIAADMSKVSRGLTKWFSITKDDARAKMFFRTRLRIMKQFADGEPMKVLKDKFSINSAEIDQARAMLESMAKDLAASMYGRGMVKPGQPGQPAQGSSQAQQQQAQNQGQPAPLNAANLEKNSQALSKLNQQKAGGRGAQAPPAPTATQPPFPFGASSPHGNPNYIGKQKDINLQLPPARKKQKLAGQQGSSQAATPSPVTGKTASPEARRQEPPKPVFLCKEPDCDVATVGFPSEQALQHHIEEDHTKPKEDPFKFFKENLALGLGLEADGTAKKATETATLMSRISIKARTDTNERCRNAGVTRRCYEAYSQRAE